MVKLKDNYILDEQADLSILISIMHWQIPNI